MGLSEGPHKLFIQQHIPPAANPGVADWLPSYAGFSWIAYGAHKNVVISVGPSPSSTHECSTGNLFQQVLETRIKEKGEREEWVKAIYWAPSGHNAGSLAASIGCEIYIYAPRSHDGTSHIHESRKTEFPLTWENTTILHHAFQVNHFSWTGCGDGLFSVGQNSVMWEHSKSGWQVTWRQHVEIPQDICTATWSFAGLTASAVRNSQLTECKDSISLNHPFLLSDKNKGNVTIWCWENHVNVHEIKLPHPAKVNFIQWRPSPGFTLEYECASSCHRRVLLTSCDDGVIRLWLEMNNSGTSRLDRNASTNRTNWIKPAFFVGALIDVNTNLEGILGDNCFVKWGLEERLGSIINNHDDGKTLQYASHGSDVPPCEWLVGIGPHNLLTLWSVHCLDDCYPSRCPRIQVWKQGRNLLLYPENSLAGNNRSRIVLTFKTALQRLQGYDSGAPSSLDVCEVFSDGSFQFSRIYPPVSAISSDGSAGGMNIKAYVLNDDAHDSLIYGERNVKETSKANSWSITSEVLYRGGHKDNIIDLSIHPISACCLAASLDGSGCVLFWHMATCIEMAIELPVMWMPTWKLCGWFNSEAEQCSTLAWVPTMLPGERTLLLVGSSIGIDILILQKICKTNIIIVHDILCRLQWPYHDRLQSVHVNVYSTCSQNGSFEKNISIDVVGFNGSTSVSWKLEVKLGHRQNTEGNEYHSTVDARTFLVDVGEGTKRNIWSADYTGSLVSTDESVLVCGILTGYDQMFNAGNIASVTAVGMIDNIPTVGHHELAHEIITGHADGSLRLWKAELQKASGLSTWRCCGVLDAYMGPVSLVSASGRSGIIASISNATCSGMQSIEIWEPCKCFDKYEFLLIGCIYIDGYPRALSWFSLGNGQLLLAVATSNSVRIYIEDRISSANVTESNEGVWRCLASLTIPSGTVSKLVWTSQGSIVVTSAKHVFISSQWTLLEPSYKTSRSTREWEVMEKTGGMCTLLKAAEIFGRPLPDYHPELIFLLLKKGDKRRARSCIRHLVHSLIQMSSKKDEFRSVTIPHIQVMDILPLFPMTLGDNTSRVWNSKGHLNNESDKYSFLYASSLGAENGSNILDTDKPQLLVKFGGHEAFTDAERRISMGTVEKFDEIPWISKNEKVSLLTAIDLLGEMDQSSQYACLDQTGQRFAVGVRSIFLHNAQKTGALVDPCNVVIPSKLLVWALHSDSKDVLYDFFAPEKLSWPALRAIGVGYWFIEAGQLRSKVEKLARAQYLNKKDPKESALLYLALDRKNVLASLFKLSRSELDKPLMEFLLRDFREDKNKAAALKNAYVLMGKHRYELAAAFFLLGGDLLSAASVCVKNLEDPQLALIICRLNEGNNGPVLDDLISRYMIPSARKEGDEWLASLLQWLVGNRKAGILELMRGRNGGGLRPPKLGNSNPAVRHLKNEHYHLCFDPDIGDYCKLLMTKVGDLSFSDVVDLVIVTSRAIGMSSSTLRKMGLPLQALEELKNGVDPILRMHSLTGPHIESAPEDIGRNHEAENAVLFHVGLKLQDLHMEGLALQYVSLVLQDHPLWSRDNTSCHRKRSTMKGIISGNMPDIDIASMSGTSEEAYMPEYIKEDEMIEQTLQIIATSFSLNASHMAASLAKMACNCWRPYLACRFMCGVTLSSGGHFQFGDTSEMSIIAENYLKTIAHPAGWLLFCTLLACKSMVFLASEVHVVNDGTEDTMSFDSGNEISIEIPRHDVSAVSALQMGVLLREVLIYAEDVNLLASIIVKGKAAKDWRDEPAGSCSLRMNLTIHFLVSFSLFILASWFWRRPDILLLLMGALSSRKLSYANFQFPPLVSILDGMVSNADGVEDDCWLIIGVALWSHLISFARKDLRGVTREISFASYGRISPRQLAGKSHWNDIDSNTAVLTSSSLPREESSQTLSEGQQLSGFLTTFHSLLKRKLALRLFHPVESLLSNPIHEWLLSQNDENKKDACTSKGSENDSLPRFLDHGIVELKTLWNMLVRRVEVYSSLRCEEAKIRKAAVQITSWFSSKKDHDLGSVAVETKGRVEKSDSCKPEKIPYDQSKRFEKSFSLNKSLQDQSIENGQSPFQCTNSIQFHKPETVLHLAGELLEAICVNSCNPEQVVTASNHKSLVYLDLKSHGPFSDSFESLWADADWPRNGWAGSVSTPMPTFVAPGVGLGSKGDSGIGLGGAAVGLAAYAKTSRDINKGGTSFGVPGYAGMAAWGLGWEEFEDFDFVDPPATIENVSTTSMAAHPLRPLFLAGSSNTHVYLWEFGKRAATATYGVLPAANMPPPYALASVSSVRFDQYGNRFATTALDGTLSTWQLDVGGRCNVCPTDSLLCFSRHATDIAFVGGSGSILVATGSTQSGENLVIWDTLAPPSSARVSVACHDGGARCLGLFDDGSNTSYSRLMVTGGKGGDICVHDFRYLATGKSKRNKFMKGNGQSYEAGGTGMVGFIPNAHTGSITRIAVVPKTPFFLTGGKDGDVKLWDVNKFQLISHWHNVHDKHTFLQHNSRGFGAVIQAAVTDIHVLPSGFVTCGGDGAIRLFCHQT